MSPLYEPQLLTAEFAGGVPKIPTRKMKPLAPLQRRYIYWARANEMSFQAIADALGCAVNTTWRRIQTLRFNPVELLDCEFIQQNHTRNGVAAYFYRFCGYGCQGRSKNVPLRRSKSGPPCGDVKSVIATRLSGLLRLLV